MLRMGLCFALLACMGCTATASDRVRIGTSYDARFRVDEWRHPPHLAGWHHHYYRPHTYFHRFGARRDGWHRFNRNGPRHVPPSSRPWDGRHRSDWNHRWNDDDRRWTRDHRGRAWDRHDRDRRHRDHPDHWRERRGNRGR